MCVDTMLYMCVCIYIYVHVYIYHVFFIHSSVDGPLGYFQVLAIVSSASVPLFSLSLCPSVYLNSSSLNLKSALKVHAPYTVLPFLSFQNLLLF